MTRACEQFLGAGVLMTFILTGVLTIGAVPFHAFEVVSPDGGFSYQLPKGWKLIDAVRARYKVAVDPHKNAKVVVSASRAGYVLDDFENGMNLFPVAIERFRDETLKRAAKRDPDFKILDSSKFITNSNQRAVRTLVRVKRNGVFYHDCLYFFQRYNPVIVWVVCSGPGDGSMDSELESIMKTFRVAEI
jgi:hypothetical protein